MWPWPLNLEMVFDILSPHEFYLCFNLEMVHDTSFPHGLHLCHIRSKSVKIWTEQTWKKIWTTYVTFDLWPGNGAQHIVTSWVNCIYATNYHTNWSYRHRADTETSNDPFYLDLWPLDLEMVHNTLALMDCILTTYYHKQIIIIGTEPEVLYW